MKVFLYYIGKPKDPHANALAADYIQRANRFAPSQMAEIRPDRTDLWSKHPGAKKILLDPAGRALDSAAFADLFAKPKCWVTIWSLPSAGMTASPGVARAGGSAGFAFRHDDAARTGPRRARRTDLPGVYNVARASLPALGWWHRLQPVAL